MCPPGSLKNTTGRVVNRMVELFVTSKSKLKIIENMITHAIRAISVSRPQMVMAARGIESCLRM